MSNFKLKLRRKLESAADLLPFGKDIYLIVMRNRLSISYRKVFTEFDAALSACNPNKKGFYDELNHRKAEREELEFSKLGRWQQDSDFPLAFHTLNLLEQDSKVLEIGGSIGHFFYTMKQLGCIPDTVCWTIAELPEAVNLGIRLASRRQEQQLQFVDSTQALDFNQWDIVLSAGTLQYMKEDMPDIISRLKRRPKHILIHNIPTHETEQFFTLQDLRVCEVPYKIFSKALLVSRMDDLGYKLNNEWLIPRKVEIPFNLDKEVVGYMGFYFEYQDNME